MVPRVRLDWLEDSCQPRLTVFASYDVVRPGVFWPDLCERAAQWAQRNGGSDAYLLSSGTMLPDRTGQLGRHIYLSLCTGLTVAL